MKPILIAVVLSVLFLFVLKANIGGTEDKKAASPQSNIRIVEIECAVPVNGLIRGGLPPCDYFPSKRKKYKPKKPYIVNDVAYKNFMDYRSQMTTRDNARREAYIEYKEQYRQDLNEQRETQRDIMYASTRARAAKRDALNAARIAKKEEGKMLSKKARKAKSRVVKCQDSSGKTFYSNDCSGNKAEKELRIVKLPKSDYRRPKTYSSDDAKTVSTITYKKPKEKQYASVAEREKATREYYQEMFRDSGFSDAERNKKVNAYVEKSMKLYR